LSGYIKIDGGLLDGSFIDAGAFTGTVCELRLENVTVQDFRGYAIEASGAKSCGQDLWNGLVARNTRLLRNLRGVVAKTPWCSSRTTISTSNSIVANRYYAIDVELDLDAHDKPNTAPAAPLITSVTYDAGRNVTIVRGTPVDNSFGRIDVYASSEGSGYAAETWLGVQPLSAAGVRDGSARRSARQLDQRDGDARDQRRLEPRFRRHVGAQQFRARRMIGPGTSPMD
jgi:hypothetical protein